MKKESSAPRLPHVLSFSWNNWFPENNPLWVVLFLVVMVVYGLSLTSEFVTDDILAIRDNPYIGYWQYLLVMPRFLARSILYFIAYNIAGPNPILFRLINVFFHIGNVWLVFLLLQLFSVRKAVAFFVAALFAVHPLFIESVTWISGGIYAQYTFFLLCAFISYIFSYRKAKWLGISLFCFICALSTSEKAIMFPVLLAIYEFTWGDLKKNWVKLFPFFGISIAWGLMVITHVDERLSFMRGNATDTKVRFNNPLVQIPLAVTSYLQLLIWPNVLSFYHSDWFILKTELLFRQIVMLVLTILWIGSFFKNKYIFFGVAFFLIGLSPTLLPLGLTWMVAERYVYFAAIGLFLVLGYGIDKVGKPKSSRIITIVLIVALVALSARTIIRNQEWYTYEALWQATVKTAPMEPRAHANMGDIYLRQKKYKEAIKEFNIAISINPKYTEVYHELGQAYYMAGKRKEAIKSYETALQLDPKLWETHVNLSIAYLEEKQFDKAVASMQKAIDLSPKNPNLYANMAILYIQMDEFEKAQEYIDKTIKIDPKNERAKIATELMKKRMKELNNL
jgi:protein O-mannosyl-transferase